MDTSKHVDMARKPILVGSLLVYATSQNSSGRMKVGIVTHLKERERQVWRQRGESYGSDVEMQPKVNVITTEFGIDWHDDTIPDRGVDRKPNWHLQAKGRPIMLDRLDEILVVEPGTLSQDATSILYAAYVAQLKR